MSADDLCLLTRNRGDGKRFVMRADEKLTVFMELEAAIQSAEHPRGMGLLA